MRKTLIALMFATALPTVAMAMPEGKLIPGLISEARTGKQKDGQAKLVGAKPGKRIANPVNVEAGLPAMAVQQPDVG